MTVNNIIILENEQKDADGIREQLESKLDAAVAAWGYGCGYSYYNYPYNWYY